jgi:peptidase E
MKLLLTSDGLTNQNLINKFSELAGDAKNKKLLCITTGPDNPKINGFVEDVLVKFTKAEIQRNNIKIFYLCKNEDVNLDKYNIILICGGNTYDYLRMIKEKKLNKKIINFVKQGNLYVGISAGSMITGPNIEGLSKDANNGLTDFVGLDLTSISIRPHYSKSQDEWIHELKKKYKKLITLVDGQAVIISDYDNYEII